MTDLDTIVKALAGSAADSKSDATTMLGLAFELAQAEVEAIQLILDGGDGYVLAAALSGRLAALEDLLCGEHMDVRFTRAAEKAEAGEGPKAESPKRDKPKRRPKAQARRASR